MSVPATSCGSIGHSASTPFVSIPREQLLKSAGFSWNKAGQLLDSSGRPVEFSIITSSSNAQRMKMATLLQDDLSHLGMQVHVVPLEFRAVIDRVFQSFDYDAAIMGLGGGDADPNPEMNVWTSNGTSHLWHLGEKQNQPPTGSAKSISLMQQQMVTLDYAKRKQLYDRVQQLIAENLPFIFLATPEHPGGSGRRASATSSPLCSIPTRCGMRTNSTFVPPCGKRGSAMTGTAARRQQERAAGLVGRAS